MPKQKDLKRIVRARMQKTGESYTAARLHLVRRKETPPPDYAALAGMSDAPLKKQTGKDWAEWVKTLDAVNAAEKPHREIARLVSSLGVREWWSQTVTVGYERIRGLRAIGQRRGGGFEANKSKTFAVPVERLFEAFADPKQRAKWLPGVKVKSATTNKRMRVMWDDGSPVELGFYSKANGKSYVSVQHSKLPDKPAADRMKAIWEERLEALSELLA
jgi:hypothetical protein